MAISNLETIIDNIEQMMENVRPDNRGRIMLPKDTLRQLLGELKDAVPIEIKRYNEKTRELEQSKNRELEQARHNAERIMNEANEMKNKLLDENEQVRLANIKANQIIEEATNHANSIVAEAESRARTVQDRSIKEYDDSLIYIINLIQNIGNDVSNIMNTELKTLSAKLNDVMNIRNELQRNIQRM